MSNKNCSHGNLDWGNYPSGKTLNSMLLRKVAITLTNVIIYILVDKKKERETLYIFRNETYKSNNC
ncbi:hypothetical protein HanRHA438_Chr02g0060751 [Helianthus annuus]|nr:hypothetical protein HanRHA438_Chr02g0060751 [Helianthus annuus]